MKTLNVEVKQEHIDKGTTGNPYACPIALAMNDTGLNKSWVGYEIAGSSNSLNWRVSDEAVEFATLFDLGEAVKPRLFTFELLETPEEPSRI